MSGRSRITKGMIIPNGDMLNVTYNINRIYNPLKINFKNKKPIIIIAPIKKKIHLNVKCEE